MANPNRFHHEFMAQYINGMAYALCEWGFKYGSNGGQLDWDYYYAMAFGRLFFYIILKNFYLLVPKPVKESIV